MVTGIFLCGSSEKSPETRLHAMMPATSSRKFHPLPHDFVSFKNFNDTNCCAKQRFSWLVTGPSLGFYSEFYCGRDWLKVVEGSYEDLVEGPHLFLLEGEVAQEQETCVHIKILCTTNPFRIPQYSWKFSQVLGLLLLLVAPPSVSIVTDW